MKSCTKLFNLEVSTPLSCPDWDSMVWDAPFYQSPTSGDGTATASATGTGTGGTVSANCSADRGDVSTNHATALVLNLGHVTYNGSGCDCRVDFSYDNTVDPNAGTIWIYDDLGNTLIAIDVAATYFGVGNASANFSVPDTLGADRVIYFRLYDQCSAGPLDQSSHILITATVVNVP